MFSENKQAHVHIHRDGTTKNQPNMYMQECMTPQYIQENKNITNVKRCRDGMPKSMQTR